MLRNFTVILIIILTASCVNEELCVESSTNDIKLKFFEYGGNESPLTLTLDSLGVSGQPVSYPLFEDSTISQLTLPVDPDSIWTQFVFFTSSEMDTLVIVNADTLEVTYEVLPSLISIDCGPELLFSELDTLYHTFDSLVIVQDTLDRKVETNIKIYN